MQAVLHHAFRHRKTVLVHVLVLGAAAISLLPYYWMVSSSLRTMTYMFSIPIQWIPNPVNWRSYIEAWHAQDFTRPLLRQQRRRRGGDHAGQSAAVLARRLQPGQVPLLRARPAV